MEYSLVVSTHVAFDGHYCQGGVVLELRGWLFRPRWSSELQRLWCGHVLSRHIGLMHGLQRGSLFGGLKCSGMYFLRRRILHLELGFFVLRMCSGDIFKCNRGCLVQLLHRLRCWSVIKLRGDIVR